MRLMFKMLEKITNKKSKKTTIAILKVYKSKLV